MPFGEFVAGINFISTTVFARTPEISTRESSNWENTVETGLSFIALFLMDEKTRRASRYRGFPPKRIGNIVAEIYSGAYQFQ